MVGEGKSFIVGGLLSLKTIDTEDLGYKFGEVVGELGFIGFVFKLIVENIAFNIKIGYPVWIETKTSVVLNDGIDLFHSLKIELFISSVMAFDGLKKRFDQLFSGC